MKPIQVLIFCVGVGLCLFGLTFFSVEDEDGESYLTEFTFGDTSFKIKYPSDKKFLNYRTVEKANIDTVAEATMEEEDMDSLIDAMKTEPVDTAFNKKDTTLNGLQIPKQGSIGLTADGVMPIAFPEGNRALFSPLFAKLDASNAQRKSIRIVHYGDSQIEGDRITAYIRDKFQKLFGGNGPGFVPVLPRYNQISIKISQSPNWTRHTVFGPGKRPHNAYGAFASLSRFTTELPDSMVSDTLPVQTAWVEVGKSKKTGYGNLKAFNVIKVHYGNCKYPVAIKVTNNGEVIANDSLRTDGAYHAYPIILGATPEALKIEFTGIQSPDFYGITCDGNYGVNMDNVAMRGSGGTIFTKINYAEFDAMLDGLNTEFVIMQYGGNLMPYLKSKEQADRNANWFKSQIYRVKKARPTAQILVIGPSDMSTLVEGEYQTYELMEYFIDQWKAASLEAGAAYWDIYRAMGGENSMVTWVENGWAAQDYTHFSHAGMKRISSLLMKALLLEYQHYKSTNSSNNEAAE